MEAIAGAEVGAVIGDAQASAGAVLPGLNCVEGTRLGDSDDGVMPRIHRVLRRVGVALRRPRCTGGVRDMPRRMSTQLQAWSQPRGSKQCPVLIIPQRVRSKRKGPCKQANKYILVPFDKLQCRPRIRLAARKEDNQFLLERSDCSMWNEYHI